MVINILNRNFDRVKSFSVFNSLVHTRQFAGSGSFTLKLPFTQEMFSVLKEDYILMWEDGGTRAVYISSIFCDQDEDGEIITVSGKNLRGLLDRRIIWHTWAYNYHGYAESLGRLMVDENAINPLDSRRIIPGLVLGPTTGQAATTPYLHIELNRENLEKFLDSLTKTVNVGFDITYDKHNKQMVFAAYMGVDHTEGQSTNPRVIITRERNNALSMEYSMSGADYKNTALITGWEAEDSNYIYSDAVIPTASGLDRREIYVKGSTSKPKADEDEGISQADADATYAAEQRQKAAEELADCKRVYSLEADVEAAKLAGLNVGDRVTVIDKSYNVQTDTHIAEITAFYENGGAVYSVILGEGMPRPYRRGWTVKTGR